MIARNGKNATAPQKASRFTVDNECRLRRCQTTPPNKNGDATTSTAETKNGTSATAIVSQAAYVANTRTSSPTSCSLTAVVIKVETLANYDYATGRRISRRNFCRPFFLSCSLSASPWRNLNPSVRILQTQNWVSLFSTSPLGEERGFPSGRGLPGVALGSCRRPRADPCDPSGDSAAAGVIAE